MVDDREGELEPVQEKGITHGGSRVSARGRPAPRSPAFAFPFFSFALLAGTAARARKARPSSDAIESSRALAGDATPDSERKANGPARRRIAVAKEIAGDRLARVPRAGPRRPPVFNEETPCSSE
jgi:hypothetical protein